MATGVSIRGSDTGAGEGRDSDCHAVNWTTSKSWFPRFSTPFLWRVSARSSSTTFQTPDSRRARLGGGRRGGADSSAALGHPAAEPLVHRRRESELRGALPDAVGNAAAHRFAKDEFRVRAAQLPLGAEAGRKLHEPMVEERQPDLHGGGHRIPILHG